MFVALDPSDVPSVLPKALSEPLGHWQELSYSVCICGKAGISHVTEVLTPKARDRSKLGNLCFVLPSIFTNKVVVQRGKHQCKHVLFD